jgi:hypothetical protein
MTRTLPRPVPLLALLLGVAPAGRRGRFRSRKVVLARNPDGHAVLFTER